MYAISAVQIFIFLKRKQISCLLFIIYYLSYFLLYIYYCSLIKKIYFLSDYSINRWNNLQNTRLLK